MTARKSVTDSLRKGLQQEDVALEARFTAAESVVSQLRSTGRRAGAQPAPKRKAEASSTERVVRESFSMPAAERATLDALITTLRKRGLYEVTRSQLLRAGIAQLVSLEASELERVVAAIERPRPGRK